MKSSSTTIDNTPATSRSSFSVGGAVAVSRSFRMMDSVAGTTSVVNCKLALDRSNPAWIRITLTKTSFGFGLVTFFRSLEQGSPSAETARLHKLTGSHVTHSGRRRRCGRAARRLGFITSSSACGDLSRHLRHGASGMEVFSQDSHTPQRRAFSLVNRWSPDSALSFRHQTTK
jgi:hypothetical protein